jgi:IS5 family transposase
LNPDNDWVKLAKLIPWAELERHYAQTFDNKLGNAGKPVRMALGALIIKERYGFSDEDTGTEDPDESLSSVLSWSARLST